MSVCQDISLVLCVTVCTRVRHVKPFMKHHGSIKTQLAFLFPNLYRLEDSSDKQTGCFTCSFVNSLFIGHLYVLWPSVAHMRINVLLASITSNLMSLVLDEVTESCLCDKQIGSHCSFINFLQNVKSWNFH